MGSTPFNASTRLSHLPVRSTPRFSWRSPGRLPPRWTFALPGRAFGASSCQGLPRGRNHSCSQCFAPRPQCHRAAPRWPAPRSYRQWASVVGWGPARRRHDSRLGTGCLWPSATAPAPHYLELIRAQHCPAMPISRTRHRSCRPLELRGCRICSAPRSQPGAVCTSALPRQLCQCLRTAMVQHSLFRGRPCPCCLAPVCPPAWHSQRRWPDPSPVRTLRRRALRARRPCRQPPPSTGLTGLITSLSAMNPTQQQQHILLHAAFHEFHANIGRRRWKCSLGRWLRSIPARADASGTTGPEQTWALGGTAWRKNIRCFLCKALCAAVASCWPCDCCQCELA